MGNTSSNRTTFGFCHDSLNSLKCRFLFPFSFSAWHEFVDQGLEQWLGFHKFWLKVDIPIQIIHYDHLLADMKQELTSLSKFLDFRVNDTIFTVHSQKIGRTISSAKTQTTIRFIYKLGKNKSNRICARSQQLDLSNK